MGKIINGKEISDKIRESMTTQVEDFKNKTGAVPRLEVILVGDDPASQVYVRNKEKACAALGMESNTHHLPENTKQESIIDLIKTLNKNKKVHGILVQLPLPGGIDARAVLDEVSPQKDVDGLHPINMGKLLRGEDPLFVPCTPQGIIELIKTTGVSMKGAEAVIVGRSNIVGKPVALLLLQQHATVTLCHSRTKDLGEVTRRADILIVSVGSPQIVKGDMIKNGAVVIDVGVNRVNEKLVGDVDFDSAKEVASFITPVPKGVGPMTITMLLKNTFLAAQRSVK